MSLGRILGLAFIAMLANTWGSTPVISEYPLLGIYKVPFKDLSEVSRLGFNAVTGVVTPEYLKEAGLYSLQVFGHPPASAKLTRRLDRQPALKGWLLDDEPDLNRVSPESVTEQYCRLKRLTGRPVGVNVSSGYSVVHYRKSCDFVMFDWYPVSWAPVATFATHARIAYLSSGTKPLYAIVQGFDWARYPELMEKSLDSRGPRASECEAMMWSALINGAKGVFVYCYDDGVTRLPENAELFRALPDMIRRIRAFGPILQTGKQWFPYPFSFRDVRLAYNSSYEPAIATSYYILKRDTPSFNAGEYLVCVNTTGDRLEAVWSLETHALTGGTELFDSEGQVEFAPFEVKVLRVKDRKSIRR